MPQETILPQLGGPIEHGARLGHESGLDDGGAITTFDITPDGKRIVFDRMHDNADIVLIELAER